MKFACPVPRCHDEKGIVRAAQVSWQEGGQAGHKKTQLDASCCTAATQQGMTPANSGNSRRANFMVNRV